MKKILLKINAWLHLWLGLVSGIIVVILSVTGCALVFEHDIKDLLYNYYSVEPQESEKQLPPSILYKSVKATYPELEVSSFWYYGLDKSVKVSIDHSDSLIYVNPYTAEILAIVDHEDFFHEMDEGHRQLWLPRKIGRQVVGWATAIFFFITLSGIILWWPKKWNKRHAKQALTINWRAKLKRINYDLHNVLGFYSLTLALLIAFTGLIMAFPFVRKQVIALAGGYPPRVKIEKAIVDSTNNVPPTNALIVADSIWHFVRKEVALKNKEAVIVHLPEEDEETVYACTDMHGGSWRDLYFDRNSITLLPTSQKALQDANTAEWISRSNYGLHTGFIGGMTTKILYFTASLICASLPITGFYIWWGKRKKKPKGRKNKGKTHLGKKELIPID